MGKNHYFCQKITEIENFITVTENDNHEFGQTLVKTIVIFINRLQEKFTNFVNWLYIYKNCTFHQTIVEKIAFFVKTSQK